MVIVIGVDFCDLAPIPSVRAWLIEPLTSAEINVTLILLHRV